MSSTVYDSGMEKSKYVRVDADLHHKAKVKAAQQGSSLKAIVDELLRAYLSKNGGNK